MRYARAYSLYECFILRARRLSSKLRIQGYLEERLKSSFRKFYGRFGDLIQQYEVSLSRMLIDILTLDQLQWLPNRSDFPPISWPWYRTWPLSNYEWFLLTICNGCGMPAGNAYPSGHLVPSPFWGLAVNVPIVETSVTELAVSFPGFSSWISLGTFSVLLGHRQILLGTDLQLTSRYTNHTCSCKLHILPYIYILEWIIDIKTAVLTYCNSMLFLFCQLSKSKITVIKENLQF